MSHNHIVSRCAETNAMVFTTPPHIVKQQAEAAALAVENANLKTLLLQLLAAQPAEVVAKLDAELFSSLVTARDESQGATP